MSTLHTRHARATGSRPTLLHTLARPPRAMRLVLAVSVMLATAGGAAADGLPGADMGVIVRTGNASPGNLGAADCAALRRDSRIRNSLLPSTRRALIASCEARAKEIRIAGEPGPPLPDPAGGD